MSQFTPAERVESLKAGCLGGAAIAVAVLLTWLTLWLLETYLQIEAIAAVQRLNPASWISLSSATVAGFLFGVTYRYTIRADSNSQLKAGAVLSFGLVRGLSQIELEFAARASLAMLAITVVEGVIYFAIACFIVDWAIQRGVIKPFSSP